MSKYKITWNTKGIKENGFSNLDISDYLNLNGCQVLELFGSSVIVRTLKSKEGLEQELKRVFKTNFNIYDY